MQFLFSHRLWFALARLPFPAARRPRPVLPAPPVWGQACLHHVPAGRRTMDYMGCEMLSVYNALHFIGRSVPLEHIVQTYERRRWLLLGGHWGADPYAAGRYFQEQGIPAAAFCGRNAFAAFAETMNRPGERVAVLSFWLGDTVFSGAHAVTLVRRDHRLLGCNLHNGQTGPLQVTDLAALCPPHRFITGYVLE